MIDRKYRFNNAVYPAFSRELRDEVKHYFDSRHLSDKANTEMVVKTVVLLSLYLGCYALLYTGWFSLWQMLGLCVAMGVGMAGIGMAVAHDAIHGAYSARAWANNLIGFSFNLIGANRYIWNISHNVVHHTYTNVYELDGDLEFAAFLRLSPHAPHRPVHRWQHITAFMAYGLATFFWVFVKDYKKLAEKRIGAWQGQRHPRAAVAELFLFKAIYYTYTIVLPLVFLPVTWWQFAIGFLAMHFTAGIILGIVFQLAHNIEEAHHPEASPEGQLADTWMIHQMKTCANFGMSSRLLTWYCGGLNYQIEHHLFPRVCSVHYPALAPIVQQIAARHGIPYIQHPTVWSALVSHYQALYRLGHGGTSTSALASPCCSVATAKAARAAATPAA